MKTCTKPSKSKIGKSSFESWLAEQPDDRVFDYMSNRGCLIASYLRETGIAPNADVGGAHYRLHASDEVFGDANSIKFNHFLRKLADLALDVGIKFSVLKFRKAYLGAK